MSNKRMSYKRRDRWKGMFKYEIYYVYKLDLERRICPRFVGSDF